MRRALFDVDVGPIAMQLPFTREQFFDLFVAYNGALWPAVVALWAASALIVALRLSSRHQDRWVSALLTVQWVWSAMAYHAAFFTRINPAAWLFAALFLGQAVLVFRAGVVQRRLSFAPWGGAWAPVGWGLIAYSLAYPAINALDHRSLLRIPTFGLPCPTTIFTAGVLMLATPRCWSLSVVPVIWSAIGGSAAFLLGVYADIALPIAGIGLAIFAGSGTRVPPRGRPDHAPAHTPVVCESAKLSKAQEYAQLLPHIRQDVDRDHACEFDAPCTPIEALDVV